MSGRNRDDYGPHSPDYGLSYEPDPRADPPPIDDPDSWESDFREEDPNDDHLEAQWEQAFREGWITREQFAQRRQRPEPSRDAPGLPDVSPVLQKAVEKLEAKLAAGGLSDEERSREERVLASLRRMLSRDT